MRTLLMVLAIAAATLLACDGGDDDVAGVDGAIGQTPLLDGQWAVMMVCSSGLPPPDGDCTSPLAAATGLAMSDDGATVTLTWTIPGATITHTGTRSGFCARVGDGLDLGRTRGAYVVCPRTADDLTFISATMRWLRSTPLPDGGDYDWWTMGGGH